MPDTAPAAQPVQTIEPVQPADPVRTMDEATFGELCGDHRGALLKFARGLTRRIPQHAEDVVQETLLRAWRHPEALRTEHGSIRPWLFRVARNIVIDRERARAIRPREVGDQALATTPEVVDEIDAALTSWTVQDALATLSADHRAVLAEVYYRGRSISEAAEILGIPPGTVKSRTYYALRALGLALGRRGGDPASSPLPTRRAG